MIWVLGAPAPTPPLHLSRRVVGSEAAWGPSYSRASLAVQTPTTSTSSQRTPASWAWWCAGAPPWCSSARRTAWRPSPTPSSSSRMPSGRGDPTQLPRDSELPSPASRATAGTELSFLYRLCFVFLIKLQTSNVPEPQNLAFSLGFPVEPALRDGFGCRSLSSAGQGACWDPGGLRGAWGPGCLRQGTGTCEARAPWTAVAGVDPPGQPVGPGWWTGHTRQQEGPSGPSLLLLCLFSAPHENSGSTREQNSQIFSAGRAASLLPQSPPQQPPKGLSRPLPSLAGSRYPQECPSMSCPQRLGRFP